MTVAGMAVLDHVLHAFLKFHAFETIVVPVPSEDSRFHDLTASADIEKLNLTKVKEYVKKDNMFLKKKERKNNETKYKH